MRMWTEVEVKTLRKMKAAGCSNHEIARVLGRTQGAVQTKVSLFHLSHRPYSRLTYAELEWARHQRAKGVLVKVIAGELGVSRSLISKRVPYIPKEPCQKTQFHIRKSTFAKLQRAAARQRMTATTLLHNLIEENCDEQVRETVDGERRGNGGAAERGRAFGERDRLSARTF